MGRAHIAQSQPFHSYHVKPQVEGQLCLLSSVRAQGPPGSASQGSQDACAPGGCRTGGQLGRSLESRIRYMAVPFPAQPLSSWVTAGKALSLSFPIHQKRKTPGPARSVVGQLTWEMTVELLPVPGVGRKLPASRLQGSSRAQSPEVSPFVSSSCCLVPRNI